MRLLVTDAAAQPPRQATAWLIMTLGRNMKYRTAIPIAIGLFALVAMFAWTRPNKKLARLGFPRLPSGSEIQNVYSIGGFSTVYMVRARIPVPDIESFIQAFTWPHEKIGSQEGNVRIFTPEELDAFIKTGNITIRTEIRENYPETFSWWTPQSISQGILFKKEGEGYVRRAYIDTKAGIAYLIYQYS